MSGLPEASGLHHAELQLAAVHHLRWYPGQITITDDALTLDGWALAAWEDPAQLRFLVNGHDFDELAWPLPSPDLLPLFGDVPNAGAARFFARHRRRPDRPLFPEGFVRFNVTAQFGEHALSHRTAWCLADPATEPGLPADAQIARVIGAPDAYAYRLGGATIAHRFDAYLRHRFDRRLGDFASVLDWGCGAGRLTRYLPGLPGRITGIDIDADNIAACQRLLPGRRFLTVDTEPPVPLEAGSFDLILGLSVLTHLGEAAQHAWLAELRRLLRPGGLALLSVHGFACAALVRDVAGQLPTHRQGFLAVGPNTQLDAVGITPGYYQDVRQSQDYIHATWSRHFDVLDIVPALAVNQDAVVLRRR